MFLAARLDEAEKRLIAAQGPRASRELETLGKLQPFVDAMQSEIGRELMVDAMAEYDRLLQLVVEEKDTEQDRAEFRAIRRITGKWAEKIKTFNRKISLARGNTNGRQ